MRREWPGAVELDVTAETGPLRALAYPELTGRPEPGDQVLLNTNALELGLGTGGYALVVAVPGRLPPDRPGPGHLVKARYTPLQATVAGADEQGSPHHEVLAAADDLGGMPVVVADLHSALPAILTALRADRMARGGSPPVAVYVMLDGGALPAWFSRARAGLAQAGSSASPRPMLDSGTGHRASASRSPSHGTVTSEWRAASGAACAATRAPNSPPSAGTTTSARASATRP